MIDSKEELKRPTVTIACISLLREMINTSEPIISLKICIANIADINLVTHLIDKHHTSLKELILEGVNSNKSEFSKRDKIDFANAIKKCTCLTLLHVKFFKSSFKEEVEHLANCIPSLPNLIELSFRDTFLYIHGQMLLQDLATTTSIKILDLTQSALLNNRLWRSLGTALLKNSSLEELILDKSPFWSVALLELLRGITGIHNNIKYLRWTPLPFLLSESLYYAQRMQVNWQNDPRESQHLRTLKMHLDKHHASGKVDPSNLAAHQCLDALQSLLVERRDPSPKTCLIIKTRKLKPIVTLIDSARIVVYKNSLTELILRANEDVTEANVDGYHIHRLVEAIRECHQLQIVRIENYQGILGEFLIQILQVLAQLPKLRIISFERTYLGEKGTENLAMIFANKNVAELDLIHSGLINDNCFYNLSKLMQTNSFLQKINFGSSPMTTYWIKLLGDAVFRSEHNALRSILWTPTTPEQMNESMAAMCHANNSKLFANADMAYCYRKFVTQPTENLTRQWFLFDELVRTKGSLPQQTYKHLHDVLGLVHDNLAQKEDRTIEDIQFSSPLRVYAKGQKKSYGAAVTEVEMQVLHRPDNGN